VDAHGETWFDPVRFKAYGTSSSVQLCGLVLVFNFPSRLISDLLLIISTHRNPEVGGMSRTLNGKAKTERDKI
jgi:hypothetical protein